MDKSEQRAALKRLQAIVSGRADEELPQVLSELAAAVQELSSQADKPNRSTRGGSNRMESGGKDRSEA